MTLTFSAILPYLLIGAGYLVRHFEVGSKLLSLFGVAAGPNPLSVPPALPKLTPFASYPILSDAVSAAIRTAVADAMGGHITSLRAELLAAAKAAGEAAVADMKGKV